MNRIVNVELEAISQKSFYGKAKIHIKGSWIYLQSYETIVCSLNTEDKTFRRHWNDWSVTTSKHVKDFILTYGLEHTINKKNWMELPVTKQDLY